MTAPEDIETRLPVRFEFKNGTWVASTDNWLGVFSTFAEAQAMASEALTQVWKLCDRIIPYIEIPEYCPEFRPGQGNYA